MLTAREMKVTALELQENFKRLGYPVKQIEADTELSSKEINDVLEMSSPNPSHVWMIREYLEDMLIKEGKDIYPFSKLADKRVNLWFSYSTPWRNKKC